MADQRKGGRGGKSGGPHRGAGGRTRGTSTGDYTPKAPKGGGRDRRNRDAAASAGKPPRKGAGGAKGGTPGRLRDGDYGEARKGGGGFAAGGGRGSRPKPSGGEGGRSRFAGDRDRAPMREERGRGPVREERGRSERVFDAAPRRGGDDGWDFEPAPRTRAEPRWDPIETGPQEARGGRRADEAGRGPRRGRSGEVSGEGPRRDEGAPRRPRAGGVSGEARRRDDGAPRRPRAGEASGEALRREEGAPRRSRTSDVSGTGPRRDERDARLRTRSAEAADRQRRVEPAGRRLEDERAPRRRTDDAARRPRAADAADAATRPAPQAAVKERRRNAGEAGEAFGRIDDLDQMSAIGPDDPAIAGEAIPAGDEAPEAAPAAAKPPRTGVPEAGPTTKVETVTVSADESGMRVDRFLEARFQGLAFSHIQRIVRKGELRVDGKRADPNTRLEAGQKVRIPPLKLGPKPPRPGSAAEEKAKAFFDEHRLYEDDDVIVINKPAGLAVQGGTGTVRHVDALLDALRGDDEARLRLVHRIDKDTSGCLVIAKTRLAATQLTGTFRTRSVRKVYWAVVVGVPKPKQGRVSTFLARDEDEKGDTRMRVARHGEKEASHAVTYYAVVETAGQKLAWLSMKPVTGRTHQLRAHAAHIGHPIIGDPKYFDKENWDLPGGLQNRLHLHARRIVLPHPRGKGVIDVSAPLPQHMQQTFAVLGFDATRYDPIEDAPED